MPIWFSVWKRLVPAYPRLILDPLHDGDDKRSPNVTQIMSHSKRNQIQTDTGLQTVILNAIQYCIVAFDIKLLSYLHIVV